MLNERPHILIMSSWYPKGPGDFTGNFVERFAELLSGIYQVSVIHTQGDSSLSELKSIITEENGVRTVRISHPVYSNKLAHWWWQRSALKAAFKEVEHVDLIFGHVILNRGTQFVAAKKHYNCPLVVMEHASYFQYPERFSWLQKALFKRTSKHTDLLTACSPFLAEQMKSTFPDKEIRVIPNIVDEKLFYPSGNTEKTTNRFLHVSTLAAVKQPEWLLAALSECVQAGHDEVVLTVVSDQPTDDLQQAAALAGISDHLICKGPLDWQQVAEEFRQHDALVLCSAYETFSIVIAEAWLSGIPVISTPVGIAKDLPADLGIQISVENSSELSAAMIAFMEGKNTFEPQTLQNAGQQYGSTTVLAHIQQLFAPLLDQ